MKHIQADSTGHERSNHAVSVKTFDDLASLDKYQPVCTPRHELVSRDHIVCEPSEGVLGAGWGGPQFTTSPFCKGHRNEASATKRPVERWV